MNPEIKKARGLVSFHRRVLSGKVSRPTLSLEQKQDNVRRAQDALDALLANVNTPVKSPTVEVIAEAVAKLAKPKRTAPAVDKLKAAADRLKVALKLDHAQGIEEFKAIEETKGDKPKRVYVKKTDEERAAIKAKEFKTRPLTDDERARNAKGLNAFMMRTIGTTFETREQWLNAFIEGSRFIFAEAGYPLPDEIKISIGFPSSNALGAKKRNIGEHWDGDASGAPNQIFISPLLETVEAIAGTVTHELCHAAVGNKHKHNAPFIRCGEALGLEGKPKNMGPGETWRTTHGNIIFALGELPHSKLAAQLKDSKAQKNRHGKCLCDTCGFTFRTTKKWVEGRELRCPDAACDGIVNPESDGEEGEE